MNIIAILICIGLMVFTIYQVKGLVLCLKERKKAQQNKNSSSAEQVVDKEKDQICKKECK